MRAICLLFLLGACYTTQAQQLTINELIEDFLKQTDESDKAIASYRIATEWGTLGKYDSAKKWFERAAENYLLSSNDKAMAMCYLEIGKTILKKSSSTDEIKGAIESFDKAILILKQLNEKNELARVLFEKGKLQSQISKKYEAIATIQEAVVNFGISSKENKSRILECYNLLSNVYLSLGDKPNATYYKNAFIGDLLLESIDPIEAKRKIELSKKQADEINKLKVSEQEKQLEIAKLKTEQSEALARAQDLEIQRLLQKNTSDAMIKSQNEKIIVIQRRLIAAMSLVFILFIAFIVMLLKRTSKSESSNRKLISEKRRVEQNSSSLILENQRLNATLDELKIKYLESQIAKKQLSKLSSEKDKFILFLENELLKEIPSLVSTLQKALTLREYLSLSQQEKIEKIYRSLKRLSKHKEKGVRF